MIRTPIGNSFQPVLKKIGQVFFLFLFVYYCRTTNSGFIRDSNLPHHSLEIKLFNLQPRVSLFANHPKEKEKKELSFVLDTGSNISLVRKHIFPYTGEQKTFRLKSISGEIDKEFGELKLNLFDGKKNLICENHSFQSLEFNSQFNFDGIIGNDVLNKFDVFLELPERAFLLIPSIEEKKNLIDFRKFPFIFSEGHVIVYVKIGNIPCRLLLDTGAGISYLNRNKANELELRIGGKASFMDLRGEPQETVYHIGENLCVDENICQKNIELLSGKSMEDFLSVDGKLDGILGLNWIENYSILIDFQNKNLYIKQR